MVQALGARLLDGAGREVDRGGRALATVAAVELDGLRSRLDGVELTVASDVDNPLLGPNGAAAVFGPQKGATPAEVEELEQALRRWSEVVAEAVGTDRSATSGSGRGRRDRLRGGGSAGGDDPARHRAGAGPARLRPRPCAGRTWSSPARVRWTTSRWPARRRSGSPGSAAGQGIPVVAVAGRSLLSRRPAPGAGLAAAYPLSDLEPDPARSIANAGPLLTEVGRRIAREWLR